jgi:metal-responsive CopG/Arc/MetJ family transcriptional regulator
MSRTAAVAPGRELKVKVSVSVSPSMLAKVDERAEELELSRSTIVQFALRHYFDWLVSSD